MAQIFNKFHHICLVVHDGEASIAFYNAIGIGPWTKYPPLTDYTEVEAPDSDGFYALQYWSCEVGGLVLQICQPGPEPTPQRAFLDQHGEGVFHIGFEVDNIDRAEADAGEMGLPVLIKGRRPTGTGFAYLDTLERTGFSLVIRQSPKP